MNKIKNKMRPSYGIKGTLSLHSFITFEMALTVFYELLETLDEFERDCITMPVDKGYLLFSKYHLISKKTFSEKDYLLQNACLYLKEYRSKKIWEDTLDAYKREREGIRLFEISNGQVIEKDSSNLPYPERKEDYLQFIKSYQIKKQASRATQGNYEYIDHSFDDRLIHFYLDENIDKKITQKQKSINTRELITISLEELIQTAEEMKVINPEDHCVSILKKNLIKVVNGSQVNPADQIVIDKVVNIVGMVGSGKTTLLKVLTFLLEKRDKRVVIVTDTVAEVFNLFRYFSVLGSNCSPLIGKSERIRYINQLIREDEMYLDEILSQYLTTNCLIDGQAVEYEEATFWGNEPCTKIKQENVRYVCPYFNRCPSTLMRRRATESPIVITTVAGMTMAKTGELQDIFLKEIVESADVVFYDECDRIQRMLDNLFMPVTSFNDYVNKSAAGNFRYMKSSNAFRLSNLEESYYNELQSKTPTALVCVSRALQEVRKTEKKSNRGKSVSAYTLLESIEDAITNKTYQEIYKLMDFYHDHAQGELWNIMLEACDSVKNTHFIRLLTDWLKQHEPGLMLKEDNLDQERIEIQKKIVLILTLIRFDHLISEIEDAYDSIEDRRKDYDELVGFLRKRFLEQQAYLPSAPTGNLFGIKETKDNDILLFRQYAYGRSLLTDLPFLRIDSEGNPLGPHVILLSGSSYAKVYVECDAFDHKRVPYHEAAFELARLCVGQNNPQTTKETLSGALKEKMMIWKNIYREKNLLVLIEGNWDNYKIFKGITDKALHEYVYLKPYCPQKLLINDEVENGKIDFNETGIRIVRIKRNDDVPDYYTDLTDENQHRMTSGLFKYGYDYWSVLNRPNDKTYWKSFINTQYDSPTQKFAERDMIEIYPIQLQREDDPDEWVIFANSLRNGFIQYSQVAVLPIPLHLANALEEYVV